MILTKTSRTIPMGKIYNFLMLLLLTWLAKYIHADSDRIGNFSQRDWNFSQFTGFAWGAGPEKLNRNS